VHSPRLVSPSFSRQTSGTSDGQLVSGSNSLCSTDEPPNSPLSPMPLPSLYRRSTPRRALCVSLCVNKLVTVPKARGWG
jgi:hypothetical protein